MWKEDIAPVPGFRPEIGLLLASLQDGTREWRQNLGEPPIEAITWQATPSGHTIGALILHMIDVEVYWLEHVIGGRERDEEDERLLMSAEVRQYEGVWPGPPAKPISWYYELQDRYRKRLWKSLETIEPDTFFSTGEQIESTARWVVSHIAQHDSYHGGQAVLIHELWKRNRARKLT